jgi:hypothetical protein
MPGVTIFEAKSEEAVFNVQLSGSEAQRVSLIDGEDVCVLALRSLLALNEVVVETCPYHAGHPLAIRFWRIRIIFACSKEIYAAFHR